MFTTVVGLDTSLTSTGIVVLRGAQHRLERVRSSGKKTDTLRQRQARLDDIAGQIVNTVRAPRPDLAVIEGPSMASKFGHPHDRSGLWWLVVFSLIKASIPVLEVTPSQRMKYATGKGQAQKDDVLTAVVRRYPGIQVQGNDQADALLLAAIGRRLLGDPIESSLPQTHLDALAKLQLP